RHYWLRPATAGTGAARRYRQICAAAQQRPTWLPGLDSPTYLDGT
ncbi:chlorophyll a-b binding protein 4 chloroplastic-like, partial [Trifolium medium]|nr:chlorophyll a-b binding protein 4 chloroplastic-like [Trifolium medium]